MPDALRRLPHLLERARQTGRVLRRLKLKILEAIALAASDRPDAARRAAIEVVRHTEREGFARFVLEESRFVRLLGTTRRGDAQQPSMGREGGRDYVARIMARTTRFMPRRGADGTDLCESLTDREIEILEMLARGVSNKDIGAALYVSENTVKYHLRNIYSKLGVKNRTQASNVALTHGLV